MPKRASDAVPAPLVVEVQRLAIQCPQHRDELLKLADELLKLANGLLKLADVLDEARDMGQAPRILRMQARARRLYCRITGEPLV